MAEGAEVRYHIFELNSSTKVCFRLFKRVQTDYFAQEPPDDESFREIFEYRGESLTALGKGKYSWSSL